MLREIEQNETSLLRPNTSKTDQVKNKTKMFFNRTKWALFKNILISYFGYVFDYINDSEI